MFTEDTVVSDLTFKDVVTASVIDVIFFSVICGSAVVFADVVSVTIILSISGRGSGFLPSQTAKHITKAKHKLAITGAKRLI